MTTSSAPPSPDNAQTALLHGGGTLGYMGGGTPGVRFVPDSRECSTKAECHTRHVRQMGRALAPGFRIDCRGWQEAKEDVRRGSEYPIVTLARGCSAGPGTIPDIFHSRMARGSRSEGRFEAYPLRSVWRTRPTTVAAPGPVTFSLLSPVPTASTPSAGIRYSTMPAGLLVVHGPT